MLEYDPTVHAQQTETPAEMTARCPVNAISRQFSQERRRIIAITIRTTTEIRKHSPNSLLILGLGSSKPSFGEQEVLRSELFSLNKWREQFEAIKETASSTNQ